MKQIITITALAIALTGCYKFETAPFPESDLKPISSTAFGNDVITALRQFKAVEGSQLAELRNAYNEENKVFEVNEEMLITQELNEGVWELSVMMKNSSHLIVCKVMQDEATTIPPSINVDVEETMMGKINTVSGPESDLKKLALDLVNNSVKLCAAIPFAALD